MTVLVFCPPFNGRTFQILGISAQHDIDAIQEDLPAAQGDGLHLLRERPRLSDERDQMQVRIATIAPAAISTIVAGPSCAGPYSSQRFGLYRKTLGSMPRNRPLSS